MEYKRELYAKKVEAFNSLRHGAAALRGAKEKHNSLQTWSPGTHKGAEGHLEKQTLYGRDIGGVVNYFDNKVSSALDIICDDEFTIHYQLFGDLGREAMFGGNTVGLYVPVKWEQLEVRAELYPAPLDKLLATEKIVDAARHGIPDRDQVAKSTGWNRNDVRNLPDNEMGMFKALLEQVRVGQSKLTRLVKGFLMLLESMERGGFDVVVAIQHFIQYAPNPVINSFRRGDRAYVFNSKPESRVHTAVLWRMCGAYPPPELAGSHITIPADGAHIFMVTDGQMGPGGPVRLSPGLIYASLMSYAMDCSCTGYMQQALVIACSLQQNRYFTKVELPNVASVYDLMVPAFLQVQTKLDKPIVSLPMAKSIGRLHQMLLFASIRDSLTAAELSTRPGYTPETSMRAFLKSQRLVVERMAGFISELSLLEATSSMHVHNKLGAAEFRDLLSISILEGLWLCQEARKSVHNGAIEALVRGVSDMSDDTTTFDVLERELQIANVRYNRDEIPKGAFSVGWVNVTRTSSVRKLPTRKIMVKPVHLVKSCDFNPNDRETMKRKVRFVKRGEVKKNVVFETSSPIPIKSVEHRARHRRGGSSASNPRTPSPVRSLSPPIYESPVPSSSSGASGSGSYLRSRIAAEIAGVDAASMESIDTIVINASTQKTEAERSHTSEPEPAKPDDNVEVKGSVDGDVVVESTDEATLNEDQRINIKMKDMFRGKMTEKERQSLTSIIKDIKATKIFEHSRSRETFMKVIENRQMLMNYEGNHMEGNSNIARDINRLIESGRVSPDESSEYGKMVALKKEWSGNVETAPKHGIRHILNSAAWRDFLMAEGVDPYATTRLDPKLEPTRLQPELAKKISLMPNVTVKDVRLLAQWLDGVHNDKLPADITSEELEALGKPGDFPYRQAPSSLGPREVDVSDSRWLWMASKLNRKALNTQYLGSLCAHFDIDRQSRDHLRRVYGLFERRTEAQ